MPKVSVIIPTFNSERYLRETLDSVVNQTLQDIEIIVVDSISKDATISIVEEYMSKDSRIKLIRRGKEWVSASRNAGLKAATGDYIMFLDSDDWYELNACEVAYNSILENDYDVVTFSYNEFINGKLQPDYRDIAIKKYLDENVMPDQFIFMSVWHNIFKKEFFEKNKISFNKKLITAEDVVLMYTIMLYNPKKTYIKDRLITYRKSREGSATTKQVRGIEFDLIALKEFLKIPLVKAQDDNFKTGIISKWCGGCTWYYNMFSEPKDLEKLRKDMRNIIKQLNKNFDKKLLNSNPRYERVVNIAYKNELSFLEKIFSVKNSENKSHKVITLLGLKLKIKRKYFKG